MIEYGALGGAPARVGEHVNLWTVSGNQCQNERESGQRGSSQKHQQRPLASRIPFAAYNIHSKLLSSYESYSLCLRELGQFETWLELRCCPKISSEIQFSQMFSPSHRSVSSFHLFLHPSVLLPCTIVILILPRPLTFACSTMRLRFLSNGREQDDQSLVTL